MACTHEHAPRFVGRTTTPHHTMTRSSYAMSGGNIYRQHYNAVNGLAAFAALLKPAYDTSLFTTSAIAVRRVGAAPSFTTNTLLPPDPPSTTKRTAGYRAFPSTNTHRTTGTDAHAAAATAHPADLPTPRPPPREPRHLLPPTRTGATICESLARPLHTAERPGVPAGGE